MTENYRWVTRDTWDTNYLFDPQNNEYPAIIFPSGNAVPGKSPETLLSEDKTKPYHPDCLQYCTKNNITVRNCEPITGPNILYVKRKIWI